MSHDFRAIVDKRVHIRSAILFRVRSRTSEAHIVPSLTTRFAEYAVTGGFFWICQAAIALITGRFWPFIELIRRVIGEWPQTAQGALANAFGALGLITVFVTGLVLDLLASYFNLGNGCLSRSFGSQRDMATPYRNGQCRLRPL
jgi:hypothetical protein